MVAAAAAAAATATATATATTTTTVLSTYADGAASAACSAPVAGNGGS